MFVLILYDGTRAPFAQIGESLSKQPCIVIYLVYSFRSKPVTNEGKQGRNQGNIREISGKYQGNIRENDFPVLADSFPSTHANIFISSLPLSLSLV